MPLKAVVRKGDPTTGGGCVLGGSDNFLSSSKPVATIGDVATCCMPGHPSMVKIIEGSDRHRFDGKGLAYDGCMLSCGCRVIASLKNFRIEVSTPDTKFTGNNPRNIFREEKNALCAEDVHPTKPAVQTKFISVVIDQKLGQSYEDKDSIVGNGECVTYVKVAGKITAPTKDWIAGEFVKDTKNLKPGTIIMTADADGKYPTGKASKHAAEFIGYIKGGFTVREQWAERRDPVSGALKREANPVSRRDILYDDTKTAQNNGNVYRIVLIPVE